MEIIYNRSQKWFNKKPSVINGLTFLMALGVLVNRIKLLLLIDVKEFSLAFRVCVGKNGVLNNSIPFFTMNHL